MAVPEPPAKKAKAPKGKTKSPEPPEPHRRQHGRPLPPGVAAAALRKTRAARRQARDMMLARALALDGAPDGARTALVTAIAPIAIYGRSQALRLRAWKQIAEALEIIPPRGAGTQNFRGGARPRSRLGGDYMIGASEATPRHTVLSLVQTMAGSAIARPKRPASPPGAPRASTSSPAATKPTGDESRPHVGETGPLARPLRDAIHASRLVAREHRRAVKAGLREGGNAQPTAAQRERDRVVSGVVWKGEDAEEEMGEEAGSREK